MCAWSYFSELILFSYKKIINFNNRLLFYFLLKLVIKEFKIKKIRDTGYIIKFFKNSNNDYKGGDLLWV